jgi:putative PIN family toxin of toxin-antitoxin system
MKLVLDSNVIIAAFATRGLCSSLFEYCLESHEIILSEKLIAEVIRNLQKKVKIPKGIIVQIDSYLRSTCTMVEPAEVDSSICRDRGDLAVLGTAKAGGAKYIVSGDGDLLVLKKYSGIAIIDPRGFWQAVKNEGTNGHV